MFFLVALIIVQRVDNAINWMNHYPMNNAAGFSDTCPLESALSGGWRYPYVPINDKLSLIHFHIQTIICKDD